MHSRNDVSRGMQLGTKSSLHRRHTAKPALAENICRMIEDRDMRIRMSQEAIAKAATFSRDAIIDRWIELFKEITEK